MTVPSATNKSGPYGGNGVTTVFAFGFRILDATHIQVVTTTAGVDTIVSPSAYSVSGVGNTGGGNVTFTTAPPTGTAVSLIRNAPFTQQVDLENQGAYYAETIEEAFDLAAMRDQQLQEQVDRSLKVAVGVGGDGVDLLTQSVLAVAAIDDDIVTVAGISGDVTAAASNATDISTVAANVMDVTYLADVYYGPAASDPATRRDGSALASGDFYFNTVTDLIRVWDGAAWQSSVKAAGVSTYRYTATAGQTVFTGADLAAAFLFVEAGSLLVTLNGVVLVEGVDYTVTGSGNSVTLTVGAALSDELVVLSFDQLDFTATILAMTNLRDEAAASETAAAGSATASAASAVLADARADDAASFAGFRDFKDMATLLANTSLAYGSGARQVAIGDIIRTRAEGFSYEVAAVDADSTFLETAGGVKLTHPDGPYIILNTGQSNAAGAYPDGFDEGPNPASRLVSVWDNIAGGFGSSDWTELPMTRTNPNGNAGKNNYGLARAHRITADTGRPVVVINYATGGRNIESWTDPLSASDMWTGMVAAVGAALARTGRTTIDEMVWAQGEANFEDTFEQFLPKLTTLFDRFDGETWFTKQTTTYFMGPSSLHDRYQWQAAAQAYCSRVNNRVQFVPCNLPNMTQFELTGAGDNTHMLGWALWHQGYFAIAASSRHQSPFDVMFYERGLGPWRYGARNALMMTSSLTSLGSVDFSTGSTPNSDHNSEHSIAWGIQCETFGVGSFAFGTGSGTTSGGAYSMVAGQNVRASGGRSAGFGQDHSLSALYTFAAGRGHTVADAYGSALGGFSRYTTTQSDPVRFQAGIGTSSSARANGITVRASGTVEIYAPSGAGNPAQNEEIVFERISNTSLRLKMRGTDGTVRSVDLTLA